MKRIYKTTVIYELNGAKETVPENYWTYGELPENITVPLSLEDAKLCDGYITRRRNIRLYWSEYAVSFKRFKSASATYIYMLLDKEDYSFADLMNKLPADEFVEWCKDHEIKTVSIK